MDSARKLGIGIVMIIPTFVGGGAVWDIFSDWLAIVLWLVLMVLLSGAIISGRMLRS